MLLKIAVASSSIQALQNAKDAQNVRLMEAREGKPVPKTTKILIVDVDGYSEEERKLVDNPMSILDEFQSLGDFKSQMKKLQDSVAALRAQGRPIGDLLQRLLWIFLVWMICLGALQQCRHFPQAPMWLLLLVAYLALSPLRLHLHPAFLLLLLQSYPVQLRVCPCSMSSSWVVP
jgi:hypothetical protein